ncbi:serine phosphatase RsbU (regulator of sigma subunit) [Kineococcus xinjiangensis]|uniref:Serine phosphatase RsbU (Regulator of sigma subunit) n=1 Tax=Kineococcus xinjiangensis TaxID=512762 RepID=A0A2S6IST3_9ACTN|nr:SpoIIE family protein phosphatase [Kineococcus xinjiangensis]PPK97307.1 serine phosphatase RsbU (regulator of sigma subunit) [Kineococcus xinjiangensis]
MADEVAGELPDVDFATVFDEAPAPFLLLTPDFVIVHANRARLEATATTLEGTVGRNLFDAFPGRPGDPASEGMRALRASLERARDSGLPDVMPITKYDIAMPDGGYVERYWSPRNVPILDERGRVVLLLHRADDITEYVRDRDEARLEAARGSRLRERVTQVESDLFARTRDLESANVRLREAGERQRRTARRLAGLAALASELAETETTEGLLGALFRHTRPATGAAAVLAGIAREEGRLELVDSLGDRSPLHGRLLPADSSLAVAVAARGERVLVPDIAQAPPVPAEAEQVVEEAALRAWAALPLRASGRLLGAVAFGWEQPQAFDTDETELLEAVAAQCAQALERLRRLEEERQRASATRTLAETLQRSLLTDPPQPDHLHIVVRYAPAAQEAHVGGDWYDAFPSRDGATHLVIGDVTGHDRFAAAAMGQLRNMLRGIAHALDRPPAGVLTALDTALADLGSTTLATALLARVEQTPAEAAAGLRTLRWSNAGHPPPLLLQPGEPARLLTRPEDVMLGLAPHVPRSDHTEVLHPGATVVLYTDGLVERRGEALDTGLRRLVEAAGRLERLPLQALCDALIADLAPAAEDDVALLAVRAHPEDRPRPPEAGPVKHPAG